MSLETAAEKAWGRSRQLIDASLSNPTISETTKLLLRVTRVAIDQTQQNSDSVEGLTTLISHRLDLTDEKPLGAEEKETLLRILGTIHEVTASIDKAMSELEDVLPRVFAAALSEAEDSIGDSDE